RGARQVIEAVTVLEVLELGLEHELESRAQHAAERHDRFGEAADPQIDIVETRGGHIVERAGNAVYAGRAGPGTGAVQEIECVRWRGDHSAIGEGDWAAEHNGGGRGTLAFERRLGGDQRVGAVGSDEVDE